MKNGEQELLAVVRDTPMAWASFEELVHVLAYLPGLVVHAAGPTDEGVRELELWRSRRELERWEAERERIAAHRRLQPVKPASARTLVVEYLLDPT